MAQVPEPEPDRPYPLVAGKALVERLLQASKSKTGDEESDWQAVSLRYGVRPPPDAIDADIARLRSEAIPGQALLEAGGHVFQGTASKAHELECILIFDGEKAVVEPLSVSVKSLRLVRRKWLFGATQRNSYLSPSVCNQKRLKTSKQSAKDDHVQPSKSSELVSNFSGASPEETAGVEAQPKPPVPDRGPPASQEPQQRKEAAPVNSVNNFTKGLVSSSDSGESGSSGSSSGSSSSDSDQDIDI